MENVNAIKVKKYHNIIDVQVFTYFNKNVYKNITGKNLVFLYY